jgi:hypothetical protein
MEADEVRGEFPPEDRSSSLLKSAGQENKEVPISGTIEKGGSPVCFIRASEDEWKDKKTGAEQIWSEVKVFFRDAIKKTK